MKFYEYPKKEIQDVYMDLIELEKVPYGGVYKARVVIEVNQSTFFVLGIFLFLFFFFF